MRALRLSLGAAADPMLGKKRASGQGPAVCAGPRWRQCAATWGHHRPERCPGQDSGSEPGLGRCPHPGVSGRVWGTAHRNLGRSSHGPPQGPRCLEGTSCWRQLFQTRLADLFFQRKTRGTAEEAGSGRRCRPGPGAGPGRGERPAGACESQPRGQDGLSAPCLWEGEARLTTARLSHSLERVRQTNFTFQRMLSRK